MISEITGFIFGGFSSRFWMMRKHVNSINRKQLDQLPFFCWECISVETTNRVIDLVIDKESDMHALLKFLIYHLQTLDGRYHSAKEFIAS